MIVAALYFGAAHLGLMLETGGRQVSLVWPSAGIALAALLLVGRSMWPAVALGAFVANVLAPDETWQTALAIAAGNTLEAVAALWLLERVVAFDPALGRLKDVAGLVFAVACGVSIAATSGTLTLCVAGIKQWEAFKEVWWTWWLGDAIGALVVTPVLLAWTSASGATPSRRQLVEAFTLSAALLVVSYFVYAPRFQGPSYPLEYVVFPFLIWAALRFGQRGTTTIALIAATTALWATFHGGGPFPGDEPEQRLEERVMLAQIFIGVMTVTGMFLGAAIAERNRAAARVSADDRVAKVLAGAPTLEAAAPQFLAAVGETLEWDFGGLWRIDPASNHLKCIDMWSAQERDVPGFRALCGETTFACGVGLPGRIWKSGRPEWIADVTRDANFPRGPIAAKERLHSAFGFPLTSHGEVVGVVEFLSGQIRQPDPQLLAMAAAIGAQIGQFMERKAVEERLVGSERELSEFFENAAVGLHWVGPDGTILRANKTELDMLGYTRDEYVGHSITEFHVDPDIVKDILSRLHGRESISNREARMRCKDGSVKHVLLNSNVLWEGDRFVHTRCFTRDVTELWQAASALRESEERFRFMADTIPSFVWTAAPDGTMLWRNQRWREYSGIPDTAPSRAIMREVVHPGDRDRVLGLWEEALRTGQPFAAEGRMLRHDGEYRWFITRAVPRKDASGAVVSWFGVTTDIHEQKLLQERLREQDHRKDEFLAVLAHELRNPLAPLSNALQLLRLEGDDRTVRVNVGRTEALGLAERQLQYLVRLVDDLLDVSRITRGKIQLRMERVALADVIARAVETSRPLLDEFRQTLRVDLPQQTVWLDVDPTRIAQVLANLLNNAAKYGDPGGLVTVTASLGAGGNGSRREAVISVRDTGVGIAPDVLPRIFDPFSHVDGSLHRAPGGLGIGLALVKTLVELHGGSVGVKSDGPGKGSEFTVRLPASTDKSAGAAEPRPAPAPAPSVPWEQPSRRVLVVDDNLDSAKTMTLLLRKMGNEVETGYDGEEAVARAQSFSPDVVLLDIGLPKINGYEAARRIRGEPWGQAMTLVALTGWGQEEDRRRSKEAGFDHHIVKPVSRTVLEELLSRIEPRA